MHSIDEFSRKNKGFRRKKRRSAPQSEILIVKVDTIQIRKLVIRRNILTCTADTCSMATCACVKASWSKFAQNIK